MEIGLQHKQGGGVSSGEIFSDSIRSRVEATRNSVRRFVSIGFLVYLGSAFVLDGSHQKTFFYFLVALPALLLLPHLIKLFRDEPWSMASVVMLLFYYALSALWSGGEGSIKDALKYSLYILCLMLAVEAAARRYSAEFIAGFVAIIAGIAICSYIFVIAVGSVSLSSLLAGRFSLHDIAGWGADNPITSAVVMGLPVISAWWLFPRQRWYTQLAFVLLMVMALVLIFISKSRGPLLALGATLLLIALFRRSKYDLLLLVGGGAGFLVLAWSLSLDSVIAQRAAAPNYRLEIWLQVFDRFLDNWILGQGYGSDARIPVGGDRVLNVVTHAHSSLFEMFRVGGVIGGGLFVLMLSLLVGRSITHPAGLFFLCWLVYGAICLSTNGRLLLGRPSVEWFAFWLPLFLLYFSTRPEFPRSSVPTGGA